MRHRQFGTLPLVSWTGLMTSNFVTVTGLCRSMPAEYQAQWNGRPLRITLDTGATLKLLGSADHAHATDVLDSKADIVERVARRLIDMRLEKPGDEDATIMISVLDLDSVPSDAGKGQTERIGPQSASAM